MLVSIINDLYSINGDKNTATNLLTKVITKSITVDHGST